MIQVENNGVRGDMLYNKPINALGAPMTEILPLVGVGPLRFGMNPSQVIECFGPNQKYEEWMGGNLNDFMFYPGILIGFDGNNAETPTAYSKVIMFQVRCDASTRLFSYELEGVDRRRSKAIFEERNIPVVTGGQAFFRAPSLGLQMSFGSSGVLEEIYLQWKAEQQ